MPWKKCAQAAARKKEKTEEKKKRERKGRKKFSHFSLSFSPRNLFYLLFHPESWNLLSNPTFSFHLCYLKSEARLLVCVWERVRSVPNVRIKSSTLVGRRAPPSLFFSLVPLPVQLKQFPNRREKPDEQWTEKWPHRPQRAKAEISSFLESDKMPIVTIEAFFWGWRFSIRVCVCVSEWVRGDDFLFSFLPLRELERLRLSLSHSLTYYSGSLSRS